MVAALRLMVADAPLALGLGLILGLRRSRSSWWA